MSSRVDSESAEEEEQEEEEQGYRPTAEFMEDTKEPLLHLNFTNSTQQLWLIKLPFSNDLLSAIDGQQLSLNLHKDGELATFQDLNGKEYDFVSFAAQEPDETVFISSPTEPKIAGKVSRRVDIVHYPEPEELNKRSSTIAGQAQRSSTGGTATASRYFPQSSQPGRAVSSKGSRQKSSLSEVAEPSNTPKRKAVTESSHGHSTGISALSSDHSHGGKSKRRKHKE